MKEIKNETNNKNRVDSLNIIIYKMFRQRSLITTINHSFRYMKNNPKNNPKEALTMFHFAKNICDSELLNNPYLEQHKEIIYASTIGHQLQLQDKNEVMKYQHHLSEIIPLSEVVVIGEIINAQPHFQRLIPGEYRLAHTIVRESYLLSLYNVNKCMNDNIINHKMDYISASKATINVFESYLLKLLPISDVFVTTYSRKKASQLFIKAFEQVNELKQELVK